LGGVIKIWDLTSARQPLTLMGHTSSVQGIDFSPDGMQLASASRDGTIRVWDARTNPEARTLEGGRVKFSPDGKWLASASYKTTILKLWDTTTGKEIRPFAGHIAGIWDVAFSPDGKWLASASADTTVKLGDVADGQPPRTFKERGHSQRVASVAFSPDGRWLASGSDDTTVKLWDARTGQVTLTLSEHSGAVTNVAFSPDGTQLASCSRDRTVRLWDVASGRTLRTLPCEYFQQMVAFSPDGTQLATANPDRTIQLWDIPTGQLIRTFVGNTALIGGLVFAPDGKRFASTSLDGTVKLWDVATGQEALLLRGYSSAIFHAAFSPDDTRLAIADNDCKVKLWDARPWTPEATIERESLGLLDFLLAKPLRKVDVLDYLRNAPTIRPRARQLALSLVDRYHEETNPETYHQESWALVRQPYLNAIQYRFALLQAEHACRLAPDRQEYRLGLGAALYRAGRYQEAIETLKGADRLDQSSPAALAFLAMAHHQLGQREKARAALARLRQSLDQPRATKDAETLGLADEAQALIAPQAATTER
jgi:WD40 repeat protein